MNKIATITGVNVQDIPSFKFMNIDKINSLSWEYEYSLEAGLINAYQLLVDNKNNYKN